MKGFIGWGWRRNSPKEASIFSRRYLMVSQIRTSLQPGSSAKEGWPLFPAVPLHHTGKAIYEFLTLTSWKSSRKD
jgi:hypothetical protein